MSIEENLSAIATALRDISVSLAAFVNKLPTPNLTPAAEAPRPAPDAKTPKSPPADTGAAAATPASAPATADTAPAPAAARDVPYEDIKQAVVSLMARKGADRVLKVLEPFGLKSAKQAKPEQYPALLDALIKAAAK